MSSAPQVRPLRIIIAATAQNGVIGIERRLPWRVPEEYRMFLDFITGQTVIWGRETFAVFGNRPPSRRNIVLSHNNSPVEGACVVPSVEEAFRYADRFPETVFIAGGASVYRQTLSAADKLYLSIIRGAFRGDAFFPMIDLAQWTVEEFRSYPRFDFIIYGRKERGAA